MRALLATSRKTDGTSAMPVARAARPPQSPRAAAPIWPLLAMRAPAANALALRVSEPHDADEREADRIAAAVTGGGRAAVTGRAASQGAVQRTCGEGCACDDCQTVARQEAGGGSPAATVNQVGGGGGGGGGAPLGAATRGFFEQRLGAGFADVRVHTGEAADVSARAIDAVAYTIGRDIVFRAGAFAPETAAGQRLLAHELVHVVQQGHAPRAAEDARDGDSGVVGGARDGGDGIIHRQPADDTPQAPHTGPPVQELPQPFNCGVIFKPGDRFAWQVQCKNLPRVGSLPSVPVDPRDIPDYVRDKLKDALPKDKPPGGAPVPGGGLPSRGAPGGVFIPLPDDLLANMCKKYPAICAPSVPQAPPGPKPLPVSIPAGEVRITFLQDRPHESDDSPETAMTPGGRAALISVVARMKGDVTLNARLLGNASSEGDVPYNSALTRRRVAMVADALDAANVGWRVFDPIPSDGAEAKCEPMGFGKWSCGEANANQKVSDPADRNVVVTLSTRFLPELKLPAFRP